MERKRSLEMDIMKIIACLSVIIIHVTGTPASKLPVGSFSKLFAIFANAITLYAVPCFILVSGIVLMLGYKDKKIEYAHFIVKRCKTIVIPYLIWCALFYSTYVIAGMRTLSIKDAFIAFALGKANYHLYFIPIILQMYLIFPFLKHFVKRMHPAFSIVMFTLAHLTYSQLVPQFPFKDRFFMSYALFFAIGMVIGRDLHAFKALLSKYKYAFLTLYLISASIWVAGKYYFYEFGIAKLLGIFQIWYIFSIATTIALFMLSSVIGRKVSHDATPKVLMLSAATFYVYLSHPYLILILKQLYITIGLTDFRIIMPLNLIVIPIICFKLSIMYLNDKKRLRSS